MGAPALDVSLKVRLSMVVSSIVMRSKMFSIPSASRAFLSSEESPRPRTLSRTWLKAALPSDLVLVAMVGGRCVVPSEAGCRSVDVVGDLGWVAWGRYR